MSSEQQWPEFLTFRQLSQYASICERKLRYLAKDSDFPVVRKGRLVRIHRASFDAWMLADVQRAPREITLIRNTRPARSG